MPVETTPPCTMKLLLLSPKLSLEAVDTERDITQYVLYYIFLFNVIFLRFIYSVACVNNLSHLLLNNIPSNEFTTICLYFLLLIDIWAIFSLVKYE